MDRVTRYPILSNTHSARVTSLALDEDTSYPVELVGVGPEAGWSQEDLQVWSAEYQTEPDVRTSAAFTRRVFPGQPSQRSLYWEDEDEEMKVYQLDNSSGAVHSQPRDLEAQRWAVIQSQAVRKGGTVATLQAAAGHRDPRLAGQPRATFSEESLVDTEQIDFLAARQQFLSLEKANTDPVTWSPTARETLARTPPRVNQSPKASTTLHLANGYATAVSSPAKKVTLTLEKSVHDSPAGCACAANDPGHHIRAESPETPKETPIEREIRLAQEREAELREQRGLRRAAGRQELIQIPSRPLLNKVSLTETPPRRDRGRPSLYVQRDMVQETQREEDHRREGRASTPDWPSQDPQPGLQRSLSSDSILSQDARATDPVPEARKVNRIPPDAYQPYLGSGTPKLEFSAFGAYSKPSGVSTADTFRRATGSPRHASECSGRSLSSDLEWSKPPEKPLHANGGVVRLQNFHLRPLRFKVPDVPQRAETSHTWGWEAAGAPALRLQKSKSSDLLEKEVESVLRREREVAEERRNAFFPEVSGGPSRPLPSKVSLTETPPRRDRGRPSLYVQRDMVQEIEREDHHQREGRASTPDWPSQDPQPGLQRSLSSDSILSQDARATDPVPEARKVNRIPPDAYQPYLGSGTPKLEFSAFGAYSKPSGVSTADTFRRATGSPRHASECSGRSLSSDHEWSKPPEKPLHANGGVVQLQNFHLRPLRFKVPDVPQRAETSHTWGWEAAGAPALRLQKSQSSDLLEKEVESVLRREREVAEERRNAFFPEVFSPELDQDESHVQESRSSSRASGITGSYSVSESPPFTPIQLHSGLVWKVETETPEDGAPGQKTKRESWYAGINPADRVNSEVLGATRVTRHKNVLAERWEARIYASEDDD